MDWKNIGEKLLRPLLSVAFMSMRNKQTAVV
jgi:hypothetical protein